MKFSRSKRLLFIATAFATVAYLGWRLIFTLPFDFGVLSLMIGVCLLLSEIVAGFESIEQYQNMAYMAEPERPDIDDDLYPDVDFLIVTHNEDVALLRKTVNACVHLQYPDKSKIHVFLCDDTNRPEVKDLADRMGVGYRGLSHNEHAKAGNMNNAISTTNSPLIASVDADMIPRSNFLMETVPYFFLPVMKKTEDGAWVRRSDSEINPEEKVGFVQVPQGFYNQDLFQFNLYAEKRVPNEQDYFFREINVGRNRTNSALFAGSNAVFSRQALEDAGGIAVNTITEDFETGIRIQAAGYRTYALSKPLAHGLAPHTVSSLISQRERWARGCIQSLYNVRILFSKSLTVAQKVSYVSCAVYWWTFTRRMIYIAAPIVAVLFNLVILECTFTQLMVFWLPYYILSSQSLKILSGNTRNQHWNNLIDTIMFPYLILPVIAETLGFRKKKFVVTAKARSERKPTKPIVLALPHLFMLGASLVALAICISQIIDSLALYNVIIIFWLLVNTKNLFFAVCFMLGRQNVRKWDRFFVDVPVEIEFGGQKIQGVTADISEGGLCVRLGYPVYLPDNETIAIKVSTDLYEAHLGATVVQVSSPGEGETEWRYAFRIVEADDANFNQYLQIVYDRVHTLPRKINQSITLYDDLVDNIGNRILMPYEKASRLLPRIALRRELPTDSGHKVTVIDFNYKYALVNTGPDADLDRFKVNLTPDVELHLDRVPKAEAVRPEGTLYRVANLESLLGLPVFHEAILRMKT